MHQAPWRPPIDGSWGVSLARISWANEPRSGKRSQGLPPVSISSIGIASAAVPDHLTWHLQGTLRRHEEEASC